MSPSRAMAREPGHASARAACKSRLCWARRTISRRLGSRRGYAVTWATAGLVDDCPEARMGGEAWIEPAGNSHIHHIRLRRCPAPEIPAWAAPKCAQKTRGNFSAQIFWPGKRSPGECANAPHPSVGTLVDSVAHHHPPVMDRRCARRIGYRPFRSTEHAKHPRSPDQGERTCRYWSWGTE